MHKKNIFFIICIIIIVMVLYYNNVRAEDIGGLNSQKQELQEEINEATKEIEAIQKEVTETLEQINTLDSQIIEYEEKIEETNVILNELQNKIAQVQNKLYYIENEYEKQKNALAKRLVAIYESSETQYLDILLKSASINEFISNYYLIQEMAEYDKDLLDNIQREKNIIAEINIELNNKFNETDKLQIAQEKSMVALENAKVIKNSYINSLSAEETAVQLKMEGFQQQLNSVNAQIWAISMENSDSTYVGGEFAWPMPGYTTITSSYGMRFHPILKMYSKHNGLDIGGYTGAIIVAANSGTVSTVFESKSYGKMIMISHGGGVSTVYAHGLEFLVEIGQVVQRGDAIMKCGSTGWSTGPHLHFEIRVNGESVDPYPYITSNINKNTSDKEISNEE